MPITHSTTSSLILGTHNRKKGAELRELLRPFGFDVETLADVDAPITVEEDRDTFAENAAQKAIQQARHLGAWVLGEDSGLVVDALDGAPGVYSARFAGLDADDASNNRFLLEKLGNTPLERRTAHYVCHAALSDPHGKIRAESDGTCRGRIRFQAAGTGGFGYDPLFEVVEYHRTFGELGPLAKAVLSHRARALRTLIPQLLRLRTANQWHATSR